MNTTDFNKAADALTKAIAMVVLLPLNDMATYVEELEDEVPNLTPEQARQIAYIGRCIAATIHLRDTVTAGDLQ